MPGTAHPAPAIPRAWPVPVQGDLVNTRSGQERLPRQFLPKCTFSVGIVAMALIELIEDLEKRGIAFKALNSPMDTTTPRPAMVPANRTVPPAAARTKVPTRAARSTPR